MKKQQKQAVGWDGVRGRRTKRRFNPILRLEVLEDRCLLSAPAWPAWVPIAPSLPAAQTATLDAAQTLNFTGDPGNSAVQAAGAQGVLSNQNGAGEVNWYTFTLTQASDVQLATFDAAGESHLDSIVLLYDTEVQDYSNPPINYNYSATPFDPLQHRLMAQVDAAASGSPGYMDRQLGAGTYYVAVSGHGDPFFNPFLADSGYAGSTGAYRLLVAANPLPLAPSDGPVVLAVDSGLLNGPGLFPAQTGTAVLNSSPLALYVDFSSPIDPSTVSLQQSLSDGSSVQLTFNPTGQFGNGNDSPVLLNGFHYAPDAMELQLQPAAPLGPGFYQLTLAGNSASGNQVLMDPTDTVDLGQNSANPTGQDFTNIFQIAGTPAAAAVSDDTATSAQNLGDITRGGIVQSIGAIGNDPAYSPYSSAPNLANPASQVELYHFQIRGSGNYEFSAEVFAGRIGSTLEPALSLFRVDASNTQSPLQLVASNDGSGNQTVSSNGQFLPLLTDPVLDVGLTAGDYYVAVSSSGNMPDLNGNPPGSNGIFDPNVSESGTNGTSTGPYVLNLLVQPAAPAPHVVSTSIPAGTTLNAAPTQMTVTFDSTVNLITLANQADSGSVTSEPTIPSVFVVEPNGQYVFPTLLTYDPATNQATFLMLDRLPNGVNELHLSGSGSNGLTGLGGNPLVGNDASGDYVVSFTVADAAAPADPLNRTQDTSDNSPGTAQYLGVLFPREVQSGVTVSGALEPSVSGDSYTVQLLESQEYQFALNPLTSLPSNLQMTITDSSGSAVIPLANGNAGTILANLNPGSYTIQISQSTGDTTDSVPYELLITMLYTHENPPPLSVGPTPVLQIRALSDPTPTPPTGPASIPPLVVSASAVPDTAGGPGSVAISSRAELAGGVTNTTPGPSLAAAAPFQVQGLGNDPVSFATNAPTAGASLVSFAILASSKSASQASAGDMMALIDVLTASWSEWRWDDLLPRAASPSNAVPQPGAEPTNRVQPDVAPTARSVDVQIASAGDPSAVPAHAQAAKAQPAEDGPDSDTKETGRNRLALVGAMFSTVLAAVYVWGRPRLPPEPKPSLKRRHTDITDPTVKMAD